VGVGRGPGLGTVVAGRTTSSRSRPGAGPGHVTVVGQTASDVSKPASTASIGRRVQ
jgi:hypothetical protein